MTEIIIKKGSGVPPEASLKEAELALDVIGGDLYSKMQDGTIRRLTGGASTITGNQNVDGGGASTIYTLDQVIDGGSA